MTIIDYQVCWLKKTSNHHWITIESPWNHLKSLFSEWCSFNPLLLMIQSHHPTERSDDPSGAVARISLSSCLASSSMTWKPRLVASPNLGISRFPWFFFFFGGVLCYNLLYNTYIYIYIVYEIHTYTYILFMIYIYIYTQINYSSLDHGIKQLRLIELVFIHMFIYST